MKVVSKVVNKKLKRWQNSEHSRYVFQPSVPIEFTLKWSIAYKL